MRMKTIRVLIIASLLLVIVGTYGFLKLREGRQSAVGGGGLTLRVSSPLVAG